MMRRKGVIINGNVIIAIDELLKRLLANNPNTNLSLLESLALEQFKGAVRNEKFEECRKWMERISKGLSY